MKILIVLIGLVLLFTFLFTGSFAQNADLPNNFDTIVYQSGGFYHAKDSQNNELVNGGNPEFVIKTALQRGGDIYIAGGTYNLSPNFSGFDIKSNTYLRLAHNANFIIPSGYGGYVFRFDTYTHRSVLDGGNISEASPAQRNWIGILMHGNSVYFNLVENMVITNPFIVIDFNTNSPNFISANTFYNINGNSFVRGIEFDFTGEYIPWTSGFIGNTFRDCQFQSGTMTTYGVKDIEFYNEAFYNVVFWDLPLNAISANIDPRAVNNIIIGGDMTWPNFEDSGKNTVILDSYLTKNTSNSTLFLKILNGLSHQEVNMPTLPENQILNMSIIQQAPGDFVRANQGQLIISPGQSAVVNIYGTVNNPKGGSVSLDITRPDGVVEQNQADVTSTGNFYYPLTFDKNSLTGQYRIDGSYQSYSLGSLLLNVTSVQSLSSNPTNGDTNSSLISPTQSNEALSDLIKKDAKLWSQSEITNDVFLNSIQYLVTIGILEKPNQSQIPLHESVNIPPWFKNNAGWWANGQISDSDFYSGAQYLINNGILHISQ